MRHAVALATQAVPLLQVGAVVTALGALGGVLFSRNDPGPELLLEAVGLMLAGRGVLALLPPGGPFGRYDVLATWAISWWLGRLAAQVLGPGLTVGEALGLPALWVPLLLASGLSAFGALPLRPRHVPAPLHGIRLDAIGEWTFGLVALALAVGAELPLAAVAFLVLFRAGLECADEPPRRAAGIAAVVAFWMLVLDFDGLPPGTRWSVELALFLVGAVVWLRRADRRGAWLVSLALVGVAVSSSVTVALPPAVAIVVATARPARRRLWAPLGVAAALCAGLAVRGDLPLWPTAHEMLHAQTSLAFAAFLGAVLVYLLVVGLRGQKRVGREDLVVDGDPPRARTLPIGNERWVLWVLALSCVVAAPAQLAFLAVAFAAALQRARRAWLFGAGRAA